MRYLSTRGEASTLSFTDALLAGLARDQLGNYDAAWYAAGALCLAAAAMCLALRPRPATLILTSG